MGDEDNVVKHPRWCEHMQHTLAIDHDAGTVQCVACGLTWATAAELFDYLIRIDVRLVDGTELDTLIATLERLRGTLEGSTDTRCVGTGVDEEEPKALEVVQANDETKGGDDTE